MKMTKPIKIRKYGKNQRALKKLLTDEETRVFKNGNDSTSVFKSLIGYDYIFRMNKKVLEIVDCLGDTWEMKTSQEIEII